MRSLRFTALALLAGLGCGKKDAPAPTTKDVKPIAETVATQVSDSYLAKVEALKAGTAFVTAVRDGMATAASLSPAFKTLIAPPELDADKAAGYSEHGLRVWLDAAKATANPDGLKVDLAAADYAILSNPGNKSGRIYLKLVKTAGVWIVEQARFHGRSGIEIAFVGSTPGATLATILFIEAALAGSKPELEALLSKSAKGKLAPPVFPDEIPQGFSRSKLNSALADAFPAGIAYVGIAQENAAMKASITFAVAGKNRVVEVKIAPGSGPGEFLIDDVQQK